MSSSSYSNSPSNSSVGSYSSSPVPGTVSPSSILAPIEIQNGAQKVTFFQPENQFLHQRNLAQMETLAQQMDQMTFDHQGHFDHSPRPQSIMQSPSPSDHGLFCQSERSRDPVYASMASHHVASSHYQNGNSIDLDIIHFPNRQSSVYKSPDVLPRCNMHWI